MFRVQEEAPVLSYMTTASPRAETTWFPSVLIAATDPAWPPQWLLPSQLRTSSWLPPPKTVLPSEEITMPVNGLSVGGTCFQSMPRLIPATVPARLSALMSMQATLAPAAASDCQLK